MIYIKEKKIFTNEIRKKGLPTKKEKKKMKEEVSKIFTSSIMIPPKVISNIKEIYKGT